jgi:hypothetical protein
MNMKQINKYCNIIILIFVSFQVMGQASVTFRVDLEELTSQGLFSNESGDELYMRGSFNDWKGNLYKLNKALNSNVYTGTFKFNIGDTISYKYVIKRDQKYTFWEHNPNPDNQHHGNRVLIVNENTILLSPVEFHYNEYFKYPVIFSEHKVKEDFLQFRHILESTHPALYDYTEKEVLDSIFDANYQKINSELEFRQFLILMTEAIARVGCGHSSLWVPYQFWNVVSDQLFPLQLIISENRTYVRGYYKDEVDVPLGSHIVSINNQETSFIIKKLSELTSADGFNPSYRQTKVAQNFPIKYFFAYGGFDSFVVEYLAPHSNEKLQVSLKGVSKEDFDKSKVKKTELSFKQIHVSNIGLLTINTFGYYGEVDMFRSFLDSVFQEIYSKGISNLILDLRGNSGGDPFCSSYLWGYLEPEPLPYFEEHYGRYDTLANPIPQPKNSFKGNLYTLIDGNGFSTTGHFCGLLKYHKVGKFIGSELGSTYTCTGNATYPPLNNTGIMVGTARVRRYTTTVKNMDPKRGVIPDYPIFITQDDIIAGKDKVLDYAISLVEAKK